MNFLDRIDQLLSHHNLNKNQLAAQTGIPVSTIYGWYKKGYGSITLPTLLKLSEFFGCSMEYLVNGNPVTDNELSPAALAIARKYDALDAHSRKVVEAVVELESRRDYAAEVERFNSLSDSEEALDPITVSTSSKKLG